MLSNGHGGFGKRFGETGWLKNRYRAPNRLRGGKDHFAADARDTGKILTEAAHVLDLSEPIAVMLVAILQLIGDDDDPYQLVGRLLDAVPSGSFLVISHVPSDMQRQAAGVAEAASRLGQLMTQRVTPRSDAQVTRFFDGLDLVDPGVVPIPQWRPESDAVGRKP